MAGRAALVGVALVALCVGAARGADAPASAPVTYTPVTSPDGVKLCEHTPEGETVMFSTKVGAKKLDLADLKRASCVTLDGVRRAAYPSDPAALRPMRLIRIAPPPASGASSAM